MRSTPRDRPFVLSNFAMTADGKIAFAHHNFVPFSSKRDRDHMMELRATADAVMAGARTVDSDSVTLGPGAAQFRRQRVKSGLAEYNLRVVVSGSGSINPQAEIFQRRFSPIIILTTGRCPLSTRRRLRELADEVKVCGKEQIDFLRALHWLRHKWGVKRLVCEGGGELHDVMFRSGLVDELHLTVCPVIFGGKEAHTVSEGKGVQRLVEATRLELKSSQRVGDEMFFVFRRANRGQSSV